MFSDIGKHVHETAASTDARFQFYMQYYLQSHCSLAVPSLTYYDQMYAVEMY